MTTASDGMTANDTLRHSDARNWTAALLVVAANFIQSISVGINAVVFPTSLEAYGASTSVIGAVLAIEFLSVFVINFGIGKMMRFGGSYTWILLSSVIRLPAIILLAYVTSIPWWIVLVFIHGLGNILLGTLLQTWINGIPFQRSRGLAMAMFGTSISLGLACGPLVIQFADEFMWLIGPATAGIDAWLNESFGFVMDERVQPSTRVYLYLSALLSTASVLPVIVGRLFAPSYSSSEHGSLLAIIGRAPAVMFAVGLCGVTILGLQSFITLYGMKNGMDLTAAALLLSSFMLGSIVLEIPFAWLSDFFDRRYVMIALTLVSLVAAVFLPIAIYETWQARILLFIWGGVIGGLYSICLAMLSERFVDRDLLTANAAFSVMDASGGIIGIVGIGLAMEAFELDGLPYMIMFATLVYFSFALTRYPVK